MQRSLIDQLSRTAEELACKKPDGSGPSDVDIRRSISTSYYCAFHFILEQCADLLTGDIGGDELERAWLQVYRGINHEDVKKACQDAVLVDYSFPSEIQNFAAAYKNWMQDRHSADYDPRPEVPFSKEGAQAMIGAVRTSIEDFSGVDEKHRRAFAVMIACKKRKGT